MTVWIDEFLYRGRPPGSAEEPAWHLVLASETTDGFGAPVRSTRVLTMAEAAQAGWALPEVIAALNAEALAEADTLRARVIDLEREVEAKEDERAKALAGTG